MKKLIIYSFMSLFLISACRKSDNERIPELTKVPYPLVQKDATSDQSISTQAPEAFKGIVTVGLFFPDGDKPAKYDLVIMKNGAKGKDSVKTFKSDITTFPTTLTITGTDLITLFDEGISLGDKFDVGVDITTSNGKKYLAFPPVGVGYGSGASTPPGASVATSFEAICKFTAAEYGGDFEVTVDGWNDFGVGTVIPITVVNDNQLSFKSPVSGEPIIIDVNTSTNQVSIAKQPYGDYKAAGIDPTWDYGVASAATILSANNFVAPCDLIISMQIDYTVSAGGFGDYTLVLKKK